MRRPPPTEGAEKQGSNTLTGWALMPANTFSDGPSSGQFAGAGAGGNPLPLLNQQPVQGFSGVLAGATAGSAARTHQRSAFMPV